MGGGGGGGGGEAKNNPIPVWPFIGWGLVFLGYNLKGANFGTGKKRAKKIIINFYSERPV